MRLGGAGCGVRHQGPFAIAEPRRSDAVSLRSARAALDAAQKTRGKVGVSGENGVGSGGSLAGNENKILVSAGITDESGQWEIYIAAFPSFNNRRQASNVGWMAPVWRPDCK